MELQIDENRIPPLPTVAARIMQFDPAGSHASSSSMEMIVGADQSISAEILRVANSSYYGRSGKIKTLKDAITLLGLKTAKNLVVLIFTRSMASKIRGDILRKHCIEFPVVTALLCIDTAKQAGQSDLKEEAFLCGLLHRIGMTMIALEKRAEYAEMISKAELEQIDLRTLEQSMLGTTSNDINALVVKKWNLPPTIAETMLGLNVAPEAVGDASHQVRITALSASIAKKLLGIPILPGDDAVQTAVLHHYGLKHEMLSFFSDSYFSLLKENPFYQNAVAVLA
ncbi:MAG: HDOD domain-containing protein [Leptospirales bacterium]|nr:HDOD domain-containing protein [Leptospirales bacterium]